MWLDSLASDAVHARILHILTCIEIPLHTFGAYLIVVKTPKKMKMVKASMLWLHFTGALVDIFMSFIGIPVIILPACSGYPLGVSLLLGIPTSVLLYIGISCVGVIGVSVLTFLENRHHQLIRGSSEPRSWKQMLYILFNYLVSITFIAPAFFNIPSEEQGRAYTFENPSSRKSPTYPTIFLFALDSSPYQLTTKSTAFALFPLSS
ncbi:G protein-coupled receptor [Caenorhabditis elegans]|uniref:G protein-coupled receptor n=1 Tax=Caenorhabditis elegans TaxID=6239 RepID=M1ZK04_CAEEL|nr:G protein-coupled receptor [Caenorhabditis elegans]CCU83366.1 G protein-coupled receptor [Caenorhabditis elegans]|eukprot:NP_001294749.1 Serpentine Receptor, class H [Caenorhabditis elegans]